MSKSALQIPQTLRCGSLRNKKGESVESGVHLIALMSRALNLPNLGSSNVLDIGCGGTFTQALLDRQLPLKRYVGVDVHREMVEFLRMNVDDPRFCYQHMNVHNAIHNPDGEPLHEGTELPLGEETFDIISLFSVLTHLAPHDYVTMLKILRRYVKPNGRLFIELFVNELTTGGHGHADKMARAFARTDASKMDEHRAKFEAAMQQQRVPNFVDVYPDEPLRVAMYSREYALSLVENTGWAVESLNDPEDYIQHYMICRPV